MSVPGNSTTVFPLPEKTTREAWYVYIVRCRDNSLYTGITKDLQKRILEHNSGPKGARYTRARRPVALVYYEQAGSRSAAASREYHLKKLKPSWKRQLVTPEAAPGMDVQVPLIPSPPRKKCFWGIKIGRRAGNTHDSHSDC